MRDWRNVLREHLPHLSQDPAREAEILEEMSQHLEDRFNSALRRGLNENEAYREAIGELVASELAAGQIRRLDGQKVDPQPPVGRGGSLPGLWLDFRYALRVLRRNPYFALFAILILAIGIASTTSIFSVVNGLLLRPLPYSNGKELVIIGHPSNTGAPGNLGYATLDDWRSTSQGFAQISAIRSWSPTLQTDQGADRLAAVRVNANYFELLGIQPSLGRVFTANEDHPEGWRVILLSHSLWQNQFASEPGIVGKSVRLSDRDYQVIGVMPEGFDDLIASHLYEKPDLWVPLGYDSSLPWACRSCQHLRGVGRLKAETSLQTAIAELEGVQESLNQAYPVEYEEDLTAAVSPLQVELTKSIRPALSVLSVAVLLLLLIACANVANMFLARGIRRRRELSLRAAIGADRRQLIRQLLTESLVLGGIGGGIGLACTPLAIGFLVRLAPPSVQGLDSITINWLVVLFALAAAISSSLLFGLAPSLSLARGDLMGMLRPEGRSTAGPGLVAGQKLLVAADLTLALVLLCGALLMIRSIDNLLAVNPGFESESLLSTQVSFLGQRFDQEAVLEATLNAVLARIMQEIRIRVDWGPEKMP